MVESCFIVIIPKTPQLTDVKIIRGVAFAYVGLKGMLQFGVRAASFLRVAIAGDRAAGK